MSDGSTDSPRRFAMRRDCSAGATGTVADEPPPFQKQKDRNKKAEETAFLFVESLTRRREKR